MGKKKRPEYLFRVIKGGFVPADNLTQSRLKGKFRIGDLVLADLTKPRKPGYHRLMHSLGTLIVKNIESFELLDSHSALKRLQAESGVGTSPLSYMDPESGEMLVINIPESISFANLDQAEFEGICKGLCRHLVKYYWQDLTEEQIQEMAELMPDEV